jgi:hypothetical protein
MRYAVLAMIAFLIIVPLPVIAGVGVSPGELYFNGMLRGGYYERYVTISNPEEDDMLINTGVEGPFAGWFSTNPTTFTLAGKSFQLVKVIVRTPEDMPNGRYQGNILFTSKPAFLDQMGGTGAVAVSAVLVTAGVEITDIEQLQLVVGGIYVQDTEECRPILVSAGMRNTGNVRVTPRMHTEIVTADTGRPMQTGDQTGVAILPTMPGELSQRIPAKTLEFACLPIGKYVANVQIFGNDVQMGTAKINFEIFPRGTLMLSGELLEVTAPSNVTLGEPIRIDGVFKNTGQLPALSKLSVEAYNGGLVGTANGDEREVSAGSTDKLTAFYVPTTPGLHKLKAYVSYEGRVSDSKEVQVDVRWPSTWLLGGAVVLLAVVVALVILARRRGKKKTDKRGRK